METIDLTFTRKYVSLYGPTGISFAAPMDSAPCTVCGRETFLVNDRTLAPFCNTCCGTHKNLVVMDAGPSGYGTFAVHSVDAPVPEPHIDPLIHRQTQSRGPIVFGRGMLVCEMGGEHRSAGEMHAIYGALGSPYSVTYTCDGGALDSTTSRNVAAYINSSADSNAIMFITPDAARVLIQATRDIYHGDEVLIDYGTEFPWDLVSRVSEEHAPLSVSMENSARGVRAVIDVG
jgi:hypothetical protein